MLGLVPFGVIVCSPLPPLYGNTVTGRWPSLVPGAGVYRTSAGTLTSRVATMKLTIERAALLKALGHVQSVVERRTTIPILSSVLLRASAGRLALSATDMDLEIVERVPCQIEQDGRTGAHALRHCAKAARRRADRDRGKRRAQFYGAALGPVDVHSPIPAAGGLPGDGGRRASAQFYAVGFRASDLNRSYSLCYLDRGDPLLSERHLSPCDEERGGASHPRGRDRRASARACRIGAARGRGRDARRYHPAKDHARAAQAC